MLIFNVKSEALTTGVSSLPQEWKEVTARLWSVQAAPEGKSPPEPLLTQEAFPKKLTCRHLLPHQPPGEWTKWQLETQMLWNWITTDQAVDRFWSQVISK